jgi:multiple antibiotic resistance protein
MMLEKYIRDALMFMATLDPIGNLALFMALTKSYSEAQRRRIAFKSILYSFFILTGSILVGRFILQGMGIQLFSLQIAGGIILFIFGMQMIFGKEEKYLDRKPEKEHDLAVFPLAVPSIAGPGAIMAVIVLTDSSLYSVPVQVGTFGVMVLVLLFTFLLFLLANPIHKIIGKNGSLILVKVMGMILAALSVQLILDGFGIKV